MLSFVLRLALLGVIIPAFIAGGRPPLDDHGLRRTARRSTRWSRRGCRVLGIQVRHPATRPSGVGRMIALNHLSWIDPIILSAFLPAVFVTSAETGEHPLLGRICASAGCVFMERRRRRGLEAEGERIAQLMRSFAVVVFPEATSSDGSVLLPFKPATFSSAIAAGVPIELFALRYLRIDGRPLNRRNRDRVCWYGDMEFLPHLLGLIATRRVEASLRRVGTIAASRCDDRKALARRAHDLVAASLLEAVA
jgi:1-acyl-sn-glycerol-3-phosphate acyltransferase